VLFSTGAWDVSMAPITLNLPSQVVPFVSGPVPPQGTNFGHIQNQQYGALVQKAASQAGSAGCPDWNAAEKALYSSVDVVPYADSAVPTFAKGAAFTISDYLDPYSIRMHG
jgi:peptide/nickel transport system substrate-binding protein